MSELKNQIVVHCAFPGCPGDAVITALTINIPDPDGVLLRNAARAMAKTAYCNYHTNMRNYYSAQKRTTEWEAMSGENKS